MGLVGIARSASRVGLGQDSLRADRDTAALEPLARLAGRVDRSAPSGRGPGCGGARAGGADPAVALDRMSTVPQPQSGRLQVSFGPIARHYAVGIDVCPAYHAWRKGAVEKAAGVITQRWSRTLGDEVTADQAQAGLDRLCV